MSPFIIFSAAQGGVIKTERGEDTAQHYHIQTNRPALYYIVISTSTFVLATISFHIRQVYMSLSVGEVVEPREEGVRVESYAAPPARG